MKVLYCHSRILQAITTVLTVGNKNAQDLKSCEGSPSCGFESHPGHFEDARPKGLSADGAFPAEASTYSKIPLIVPELCPRGTNSNSLQPTQAKIEI